MFHYFTIYSRKVPICFTESCWFLHIFQQSHRPEGQSEKKPSGFTGHKGQTGPSGHSAKESLRGHAGEGSLTRPVAYTGAEERENQ